MENEITPIGLTLHFTPHIFMAKLSHVNEKIQKLLAKTQHNLLELISSHYEGLLQDIGDVDKVYTLAHNIQDEFHVHLYGLVDSLVPSEGMHICKRDLSAL